MIPRVFVRWRYRSQLLHQHHETGACLVQLHQQFACSWRKKVKGVFRAATMALQRRPRRRSPRMCIAPQTFMCTISIALRSCRRNLPPEGAAATHRPSAVAAAKSLAALDHGVGTVPRDGVVVVAAALVAEVPIQVLCAAVAVHIDKLFRIGPLSGLT